MADTAQAATQATSQRAQNKTQTQHRGQHSVAYEGLYSLVEIGGWLYCSFQQIITTHDSLYGILQGGTMIPSNVSAQQLLDFLQGNAGKYHSIAWTVALVTQIAYWGAALPGGPLHRKWLHQAIVGGFLVLEIVTDLWYSVATNTTIGGAFSWVFNFGNGGWIAALAYIAAMAMGGMFLGWRGFNRFSRVFGPVWRAAKNAQQA